MKPKELELTKRRRKYDELQAKKLDLEAQIQRYQNEPSIVNLLRADYREVIDEMEEILLKNITESEEGFKNEI